MRLLFILLPCFIFASSFKDLSLSQQKVLYQVFKMSKKTKYKWTLVAIAWQESMAGIAQVNIFDGGKHNASCGLFHTLISSVFARHPEWIPNKFNKNKICTKLVLDRRFAFKEAKAELDYWYNTLKGNWFNIWGAYNAGFAYKSKQGRVYAYQIARKIRELKKHIGNRWEHRFKHIK